MSGSESVSSSRAAFIEPASIAEQLLYLTVKITGKNAAGAEFGGTGFFYQIAIDENHYSTILVANQHVVRSAVGGVDIRVHTRSSPIGAPDGITTLHLDGDLTNEWIAHPSGLDLCGYPIQSTLNSMTPGAFISSLGKQVVPSPQALSDLDAIEEVVMIGYPRLLSDEKNNCPIVRRGITATHPAIDFEGRPEIAIDIPVFGGSSGSPVVLYYTGGSEVTKNHNVTLGNRRTVFLGVLWGGPTLNQEGVFQITEAPIFNREPNTISGRFGFSTLMNVGFIIKAREVVTLASSVAKKLGLNKASH